MSVILSVVFFLMNRRPPRSTLTDTIFPSTTLFRSTTVVIPGDHNQVILGCQSGPLSEDAQSNPRAEGRTPGSSVGAAAGWALSGFMRRSEEHTSELQSLMRISYAVFCLKKKKKEK